MGIRINTGTVKIEVNDDGEFIVLPLGDDTFIRRFYDLLEKAEAKAGDIDENQDVVSQLDAIIAFDKEMVAAIDDLIGRDTCRKVFGDILPGAELFLVFLAELAPYIEKHRETVDSRINKYNPQRTGSSV